MFYSQEYRYFLVRFIMSYAFCYGTMMVEVCLLLKSTVHALRRTAPGSISLISGTMSASSCHLREQHLSNRVVAQPHHQRDQRASTI
jgi:hypothetical protein